jgi:hypothetical protein
MKDMEESVTSLTTSSERALAGGHWLLPAAPDAQQGNADWKNGGAAWLRPGVLFGAVIIRVGLIHAALGLDDPVACALPLAEGLDGGPLFYSPDVFSREGAYTALVPASAAMAWNVHGSMGHHYRALLLIPVPDVIEPQEDGPWWVVPLDGPGLLCPPDRLAALVTLGREATRKAIGRPGGDDDA